MIPQEACFRPMKLIEKESECKTDPVVISNTATFLEHVQENVQAAIEQTKKLLNIAKKKLGFDTQETTQEPPKKVINNTYHEH